MTTTDEEETRAKQTSNTNKTPEGHEKHKAPVAFFSSIEKRRITVMVVLIALVVIAAITVTIIAPIKSPKGEASDEQITFRGNRGAIRYEHDEHGEFTAEFNPNIRPATAPTEPFPMEVTGFTLTAIDTSNISGDVEKIGQEQMPLSPDANELTVEAIGVLNDFIRRAYLDTKYFYRDPEFNALKEVCTDEFSEEVLSTPEKLNEWTMGPEGYQDIKEIPSVSGAITFATLEYQSEGGPLQYVSLGFDLNAQFVSNEDGKTYNFYLAGTTSIDMNQMKISDMEFQRSIEPIEGSGSK